MNYSYENKYIQTLLFHIVTFWILKHYFACLPNYLLGMFKQHHALHYCIFFNCLQVATNDEDLIGKIQAVAQAVTDALNNLLEKVQFGSDDSEKAAEKNVYEMILDANDALFRSLGNGDEMVRQATILGQVCGYSGHF